ncbi:hypothetical protein CAC42_2547 [Sphaceloma murrayae]|uniref:Microbial-type PARG catalytic domain-containing protein n=1 Tax=Sphaceloma murrayae TaxID=2082308 RepID=A0A2K1QWN0_9PEZI|nr:hypothetical protein CAC42_2547 [Sphaceloma murrayae]
MVRLQREPIDTMLVHGLSRDDRAARAINTVNKTIPEYLRISPRARHGIHNSVEIIDPPPQREDSPTTGAQPQIRIRVKDTDTLTAARQITYSSRRASMSTNVSREQATKKIPNVCILNQAAAIKPGGGFLEGIHSQEEFLCQRSTLYASLLRENLYPLPEVGGVWSPDVLVFGDSSPEAEELQKRDRVFVDVITACMIRFPGAPRWRHDGDTIRPGCSCGVSYCDVDRDLVMSKMRAVLRIAQAKGAEKLVLGAWGCGLYGNPPREVARLWKKTLFGTSKAPAVWPGIREVVFAINDKPSLREFEKCFSDLVAFQAAEQLHTPPPERSIVLSTPPPKADPTSSLVLQITDLETQIATTTNNRTRHRLRDQLATLNKKLADLGNSESPEADEDENEEDAPEEADFVMHGYPASDGEDNSYYNFDENDVASSSESATPASAYEFRFEPASRARTNSSGRMTGDMVGDVLGESFVHAVAGSETESPVRRPGRMSSFEEEAEQRRRLDESGGWFSGSVNQLSALMRKTGQPPPALSPADQRVEDSHFPEY